MLAASLHTPAARVGEQDMNLRQRQLLASFCRLLGDDVRIEPPIAPRQSPVPGIQLALPSAPRLREILGLLLAGDGEKQIAAKLKLSRHTVHQYVKAIYKHFEVSSRGELLAMWVKRE